MKIVRSLAARIIPGFMVALVATTLFGAGCGSSGGAKATIKCVHDSDCSGALVCTQGYCVGKCESDKDCNGARCIKATEGPTCQPTQKVTCQYNSDCTQPLVCSGDLACRSQCKTNVDCPMGQVCTTTSKLCADPALDKNYDSTTMDFKGATAAFGAGMVAPDGGADAAGDHPTGAAGAGGSSGAGGSTSDGGAGKTDAAVDVPSQPEVGIAASCPGTPMTLFGRAAVGDENDNYVSGLGIRLPTEMVIFNGFTGFDEVPDGGADAGDAAAVAPSYVNRIDLQRFDLQGVAKGPSARWQLAMGSPASSVNPESIYLNGASAAPSGEVALVYSAGGNGGASIFMALLAPTTLDVVQTVPLQSYMGTHYGHQAHVQWEDGQFVASWVSFSTATNNFYLNVAAFLKDGTPTGSASSIPADSTGRADNTDYDQASAAFLNGVFALAFEAVSGDVPGLAFVGTNFNSYAPSIALPYSGTSAFTEVAALSQGFVAIYNGTAPQVDGGPPPTFSTIATFVSPPTADGGANLGTTVALPGVNAYNFQNAAREASDPLGAGFALLTNDGKATFAYFEGDGTKHLGPSQVIQQAQNPTDRDMVHLMTLNGSYALSLYTRADHLTRLAVSGCPATTN